MAKTVQSDSPAVFLDRDGTIIEEKGYLSRPGQIVLLDHAVEAIRLCNQRNVPVIVVSNQSGVARGYFSEDTVREINHTLSKQLEKAGAHIDGFYFCPHHPEYGTDHYRHDCSCRKPNIGMLQQAARDYDITLSRSYLIGDSLSDIQAARNAGMKAVLVMTGYGGATLEQMKRNVPSMLPDYTADNLEKAVHWIMQDLE